jgi:hypothetical protein
MVGKRRAGLLQLYATGDPAVAEASLDSLFREYPSLEFSPKFVPKRPTTRSGRASASAARRTQTAAVQQHEDHTGHADGDDVHKLRDPPVKSSSRSQPATHRRGLSFRSAPGPRRSQLQKLEQQRPSNYPIGPGGVVSVKPASMSEDLVLDATHAPKVRGCSEHSCVQHPVEPISLQTCL